jgi:hypothetical protein
MSGGGIGWRLGESGGNEKKRKYEKQSWLAIFHDDLQTAQRLCAFPIDNK